VPKGVRVGAFMVPWSPACTCWTCQASFPPCILWGEVSRTQAAILHGACRDATRRVERIAAVMLHLVFFPLIVAHRPVAASMVRADSC
jgi:hypothetical protein